MSIKIQGAIEVKTISGRNGDFRVGTLVTSIGDFQVKGRLIQDIDDGIHHGEFVIEKLELDPFSYGGKFTVGMTSRLSVINLSAEDSEDESKAEDVTLDSGVNNISEPEVGTDTDSDPAPAHNHDIEPTQLPWLHSALNNDIKLLTYDRKCHSSEGEAQSVEASVVESPVVNVPSEYEAEYEELFGEFWPLGLQIKLDPVTSRSVLSQQMRALSHLNYVPNMKTQVWELNREVQ